MFTLQQLSCRHGLTPQKRIISLSVELQYITQMTNHIPLKFFICFSAAALACLPEIGFCIPFGAPDSRSAAMGKTGVASIENTNAGYFNPALLAMFSKRKHLGGNQRIAFPSLSGYASDDTIELIDIDDKDYETTLFRNVADFNNNTNTDSLINTLESITFDLNNVSSDALFADVSVGGVLRIPDQREGGALYVSRRAVFDGRIDFTESDEVLLANYIEELNFVADGGTPGTLHPQLYNGGQLINPSDSLSSSVDAVALVIDEIGFSMGWSVSWWDFDMMLGVTPKVVQVTTNEYSADAISGDLTNRGKLKNDPNVNLDLGWAKKLNKATTIGVSIHNLIPQEYDTESNRIIKLKPQLRIGGAHQSKWGNFAVDLDLIENDPLSQGDPTQELGIGGEWKVGKHYLRAGAVKNFAASGDNGSPLFTLGARINLWGFYSDLSYGNGSNQESAALQFGLRF
jgi:hypothetical protein